MSVAERRDGIDGELALQTYQIGEVAELTGLTRRTLRHYDQLGVVRPEYRSRGQFRVYTERQVARLRLISALRPMGLSLPFLRSLITVMDALDEGGDVDAAEVRQVAARLRRQQEEVERQIIEASASLDGLRSMLQDLPA
ncbi:MAG: MerR family transcriptional regulator [Acidimicrobiia bacterium]